MPKPHQIIPKADRFKDEQPLWRYIPLSTLFYYLSGSVFIPSVEKLRIADPYEGPDWSEIEWFNTIAAKYYEGNFDKVEASLRKRFTQSETEHIEVNKKFPNYEAKILAKHYFEFLRNTRYAWCWFAEQSESAAMWKVYGNRGAAIRTTVGKLCTALEQTRREFVFREMNYVAFDGEKPKLDPENEEHQKFIFEPYFLKREEYKHEHEVRFVTCDAESTINGIYLHLAEPSGWIDEVLLCPELILSEADAIAEKLVKMCSWLACRQSNLLRSPDASPQSSTGFRESLNKTVWDKETPAALKQVSRQSLYGTLKKDAEK